MACAVETSGHITVFDDLGEALVAFDPTQAFQSFEPTEEFGAAVATTEKDGYRLEMGLEGPTVIVTLFEADDLVGSWVVAGAGDQPGLTFTDDGALSFSDLETGEELVVFTEAEGDAAFEEAFDSGAIDVGQEDQTIYVIASRDGVNWQTVAEVDGFGGPLAIGEDEMVFVSYAITGTEVTVLPLPDA